MSAAQLLLTTSLLYALVQIACAVAMLLAGLVYLNALGNAGKVTLPEVTGTAAWMWVAALAVGGTSALLVSARHVGGGPKQPTGGTLGRPQAAT